MIAHSWKSLPPEQKSFAQAFFVFLGASAVGHVAGLAGTGYLIKAGINVLAQSGFDHKLAGTTTLVVGGVGFYKVFRNAASELLAFYHISQRNDAEDNASTPNGKPDHPERVVAPCDDAHNYKPS
jgi:hypothetical protein